MPSTEYKHVALVAVGSSADRKLNLAGLAKQLNRKKGTGLSFSVLPVISKLPLPDKPAPFYTSSQQYGAEQVIELIKASYGSPAPGDVICAAIDHEIYNELFSTIDESGRVIIVSLRNSTLHQILRASNSTLEQYLLLEMSLQLLSSQYRSVVPTTYTAPDQCTPPWHLDRRQCLFDYFGISPQDTSKLRKPGLCESCNVIFAANGELQDFYRRIMPILQIVAQRPIGRRLEAILSDPINAFIVGAIAGVVPSLFNAIIAVSVFAGMLLVALAVQLRRNMGGG